MNLPKGCGRRWTTFPCSAIVDRESELMKGSEYIEFICEVPNSMVNEIFTYNEILDHIEKNNIDIESDTEQLYKF
jgi:t-SNARE complex subunit (syntaxin)